MNFSSLPLSGAGFLIRHSRTANCNLLKLMSNTHSPTIFLIGALMSFMGNPSPLKMKVIVFESFTVFYLFNFIAISA